MPNTRDASAHTDSALPDHIGPYKILGTLGQGGMGVVYEAQQGSPKRKVAVKVVRGGQFVDEHHVRMFQREADTLARLKHSNIGGIYESGRTEDGQHFFAMELVRGDALDAYMRSRPTVTTQGELRLRLALFRKIADAVHYAHQRGVIHRDLKPSNIIVTEEATSEDSRSTISDLRLPEIKILDFGLARITEGDVAAATMTTEVGVIKGTLPYMSPEQARGNPEEIDVRTDVYALGVILFEMLTGQRPYDVMRKSVAEAVRVICEEPARSLAAAISGVRRLDPDVETVVSKALEKDANRRYASAAALSEDLGRWLASQPILARPPSTVYQLRKFAGRNRALVGGVAATFVALLTGAVVSVVFGVQAQTQRKEAVKEAETSKQALDFMTGMFQVSDPSEARGNSITAREILDRGTKKIDESLADQPEIQARLMFTMGTVYMHLGLYPQAEPLYRRAVEIRERVIGDDHPETLSSIYNLAALYTRQQRYDEAEPLLLETLKDQERVLGGDHWQTLRSMLVLSTLYMEQGRNDEAEQLFLETLEVQQRALGSDHRDTLFSMNNLANLYLRNGRYDEAEPLYAEALEVQRRTLGDDHPDTLRSLGNLAILHSKQGRYDEAEPLYLETLEIQRRVLGDDHPLTALILYNLGCFEASRNGNNAKAMDWLRQSVGAGFARADWMGQDEDLKSLHGPEFDTLVERARRNAAAQRAK